MRQNFDNFVPSTVHELRLELQNLSSHSADVASQCWNKFLLPTIYEGTSPRYITSVLDVGLRLSAVSILAAQLAAARFKRDIIPASASIALAEETLQYYVYRRSSPLK